MSAPDPEKIVRKAYAALARGDLPGLLHVFAPDMVWDSRYPKGVPFGGVWRGHDEIVDRLFNGLVNAISMEIFETREILSSAGTVIALGYERSLVRATGRVYENEWTHVWRLRDGLLVSLRTYNDNDAIAAAFATG